MVVSVCESWREVQVLGTLMEAQVQVWGPWMEVQVQVWGSWMEVQVRVWLNGALRHCWMGALALVVWSGVLKLALGFEEQWAYWMGGGTYSTQALSSYAHRHFRSVLEAYRSAEVSARLSVWQTHQLQQHHRTG